MSLIQNFESRWVPAWGLDTVDARYGATVTNSFFGRAWNAIRNRITTQSASAEKIGSLLQQLGFLVAVLLFLILPASQFTDDKWALAIVVAAGYGLRVLGLLLNGREQYKPSAIDGIVLLYFSMHLVASFSSHYLSESLFGLAKNVVYLFAYFLFVWSLQIDTNKRSWLILGAMIASAVAVSLYGLYQYKIGVAPLATWEDPTVEDKATRIYSTLKNPNLLAGYLLPMMPIAAAMGVATMYAKGWKRWLWIPLCGMAAVIKIAIILTQSRGGWAALGVEDAVMLLILAAWVSIKFPKWRPVVIGTLVGLPLLAVAVVHFKLPSIEHRFMSIFAGSEHSSNAYRMNVYRASLKMLRDNWVLGIGSGNKTFVLAYGLYMKSGFDALGTYCVPLEIAVEAGIGGLFAFLWMLFAVCSRAHNRFWQGMDETQRWLALGAMVGIIGMMVQGFVDTVFLRPQVQFPFWLLIALLTAMPAPQKKN